MDYPSKQGEKTEDKEDIFSIDNQKLRVLRGGSFSYQASHVRSASRANDGPALRTNDLGFRPARTFTP
jgi:formylglycine-generating enzyme required for sulfatase activity